ncbi:hypothetical protein G7Y41_08945 [Schaalia sp. ZJ405]|uniref:hypothetical protein n=1 Tax=Schaalia sp. ZJ405 TaxID=2709403 RepID=UPI0013EDF212|nr:hypothetical protein [Schaalia sp. ZJ405]QPK81152.1 hypothetical protein G7Y41_08945 [Schaalia sp. ZJ405]
MKAPTYMDLLYQARRERVEVVRAHLTGAAGLWDAETGTIYIDSALSDAEAAPVLAHELIHVRRGDTCSQSERAERLIDERVAAMFVEVDGYAYAEQLYPGDAVSIADELSLPAWVVEAFQRARLKAS